MEKGMDKSELNLVAKTINGTFTRASPADFAEKVGIPAGWFVVSWRWMPETLQRRAQHGKWYKITSKHESIYRVLRFSTKLNGGEVKGEGQIVMDWSGWIELSGFANNTNVELTLEITPVSWWKYLVCVLSHPDPIYRLASELAILSVALGILSVVLAVV